MSGQQLELQGRERLPPRPFLRFEGSLADHFLSIRIVEAFRLRGPSRYEACPRERPI